MTTPLKSRLAANLTFMFNDMPFIERFEAAAQAGFNAVEFLFPYQHSVYDIAQRLQDNGLQQILFNLPAGDWTNGERGIAAIPGREHEFLKSLHKALDYAHTLNCRYLHVMAGVLPNGVEWQQAQRTYMHNLQLAAEQCAAAGIQLLIEPINSRDMPAYFLTRSAEAHAIIEALGQPNVGMLWDIYHCQIMEGDLTRRLRQHFDIIQHIQIASVPDRHEPDRGEINYAHIFQLLKEMNYQGWIGCEYRPHGKTVDGLTWISRLLL